MHDADGCPIRDKRLSIETRAKRRRTAERARRGARDDATTPRIGGADRARIDSVDDGETTARARSGRTAKVDGKRALGRRGANGEAGRLVRRRATGNARARAEDVGGDGVGGHGGRHRDAVR